MTQTGILFVVMGIALIFGIGWAYTYKLLSDSQSFQQDIREVASAPILLLQGTKIRFANTAGANFFGGFNGRELAGRDITELMTPDSVDKWKQGKGDAYQIVRSMLLQFHANQNGIRFGEVTMSPVYYRGKVAQQMTIQDKTEEVMRNQNAERMAYQDGLTGLPNRVMFKEMLEKYIRDGVPTGLMMLDLDHFKQTNDTLGHNAGDALLKGFANRLKQCVRGHDMPCRLAGDEFVILLPNLKTTRDAENVAHRIVESMREPFILEGKPVSVTTSIGITFATNSGLGVDDIVKQADDAMYHSKQNGKNQYTVYSPY